MEDEKTKFQVFNIHKDYIKILAQNKLDPLSMSRLIFIFTSVGYNILSFFISDIKLIDNFPKTFFKTRCIERYESLMRYAIYYINFQYLKNKVPVPDIDSDIIDGYDIIKEYLDNRFNDNWNDKTPFDPPNKENFIEINIAQDISSWPNPELWTPIRNQVPLGPNWHKVDGVLPSKFEADLLKYGQDLYIPIKNKSIKILAQEILTVSQNLTDKEKSIAELYEGGKITPSGLFYVLLICHLSSGDYNIVEQINSFVLLGLNLFETSKIVWTLKYQYLQARPIQSIRDNFKNILTSSHYGVISADRWVPYQRTSFFTPPFPDYPSGHSAFSSSSSFIMESLFGKNIPKNIRIHDDLLPLISDIFNKNIEQRVPVHLYRIDILQNSSAICNVLPRNDISLFYSTWEDICDDASNSRTYGGIHYLPVVKASREIGHEISKQILKCYSFLLFS